MEVCNIWLTVQLFIDLFIADMSPTVNMKIGAKFLFSKAYKYDYFQWYNKNKKTRIYIDAYCSRMLTT